MSGTAYPSYLDTANSFFQEAVRHLNDASLLYANQRYAATVASAHKAQELAVKSSLVIENSLGMWEKLFKTHKPLTEISGVPALNVLNNKLNSVRSGLSLDARELEQLEPTAAHSRNPEYPYHGSLNHSISWMLPGEQFDQAEAARLYNTAREVVVAIQALCAPYLTVKDERMPDAHS